MKSYHYLQILIMAFALTSISCSNKDDEEVDNTPQYNIIVKDTNVGVNQTIELFCDYQSPNNNPNIAITWFDNDTRCNNIPHTHGTLYWIPQYKGTHHIKVVITDMNSTITCEKDIEVTDCDLGLGIIGDSKEKIARTIHTEEEKQIQGYNGGFYYLYVDNNDQDFPNYHYYFYHNELDYITQDTRIDLSHRTSLRTLYIEQGHFYAKFYKKVVEEYGQPISGAISIPRNEDEEFELGVKIQTSHIVRFKRDSKRDLILYAETQGIASTHILVIAKVVGFKYSSSIVL